MAFIQIDPNSLKLDAPSNVSGTIPPPVPGNGKPPSGGGYVRVSPDEIKLDGPSYVEDAAKSFGSGLARGIPNIIDIAGAGVAKGVDFALDKTGVGDALGLRTGVPFADYAKGGGLNTLVDAAVGERYQPQTKAGEYANMAGQGISTAALTPLKAASLAGSAVKTIGSGAASGLGGQAGGDIGEAVGGDAGRLVGSFAGGIGGAAAAEKSIAGLVRGAEGVAPKYVAPRNADDIRALASEQYKKAEQLGGLLSKDVTNNFIAEASKKLKPQTKAGALVAGDTISGKLADRVAKLVDQPLTLDEAQEIDEFLGDTVDSLTELGKVTKEGKKVLDLQTSLREAIEAATPDNGGVVGGKDGFEALKEGRKLWSTQARLRDVEKIITRAEMTDNPATAIKTGFKNLATNPQRMRGYTQAERKAIEKAANSGVITDVLRIGGSRLIPMISGATGGFSGAVAGQAASMASRGAATKLQVGKAQQAADLIARGVQPTLPEQAGQGLRRLFGPVDAITPPVTPMAPPSSAVPAMQGSAAGMNQNMASPAQSQVITRLPNNQSGALDPRVAATLGIGSAGAAIGYGMSRDGNEASKPAADPEKPKPIEPQSLNNYLDKTRIAESGGRNNAQASTSSAFGPYQFTRKTWRDVVDKYGPKELKNAPDIMSLRSDPNLSRYMAQKLAEENASQLAKRNVPVTDGSLYVAHFAGGPRAARLYTANPKAPASKFFAEHEIAANKSILKDKTVAQVIGLLERKMA